MNNLIRILALKPDDLQRVIFAKSRKEGGISPVYDPSSDAFTYRVFIHNILPLEEIESWEFANFEEARAHASKFFGDWEMLTWDLKTKRPCEEGGKECGQGECDTCKSMVAKGEKTAPGCGACGA